MHSCSFCFVVSVLLLVVGCSVLLYGVCMLLFVFVVVVFFRLLLLGTSCLWRVVVGR